MAEPAVPRVTWEDWYAWSMDQFGGDAQLAHLAARAGREALDVGATQEAATRAALSAAEAGRDKPNTAELQPQAKSAWVKKPSPSEPDADAVSSGPPNEEGSANALLDQPPEISEPPSASSDVAAGPAAVLSPGEEPTSALPGRTPDPAAQPIVSPDGTQILINRAWYVLSPDRREYWNGSKWMRVSAASVSVEAPTSMQVNAEGESEPFDDSWAVGASGFVTPQSTAAAPTVPARKPLVPARNPFVGGFQGCLGVGAAIVVVLVIIGLVANSGSPSAQVSSWQAGSAHVEGTVTGGSTGCTDMHVQIKLSDKNSAVQHTYDLTVNNVGAKETKSWQTEVSGIGPEPVTSDITSASATADCRDQHS